MILVIAYFIIAVIILHISILTIMRHYDNCTENGQYYSYYDKESKYIIMVVGSIMWPVLLIIVFLHGITILGIKWFQFIYKFFKVKNGTNTP